MRKLVAVAVVLLLVFSLTACVNENSIDQSRKDEQLQETINYKTTTNLSYGEKGIFVGKILGEGLLCYLQMDDTVHYTNENGKEYEYDVIHFYDKDSVKIEDGGYVGKSVVIQGNIYDYRGGAYYFESYDIVYEQGETTTPESEKQLHGWETMTNEEKAWEAVREFVAILYRSELFGTIDAMMNGDSQSYIEKFSKPDGSFVVCYPVEMEIDCVYLSGRPNSLGVIFAFEVYEDHFEVEISHPFELEPHTWTYDWNGNCIGQKNPLDESDSRTSAEYIKCCIAELS